MRSGLVVGFALIFSAAAWAQHRGSSYPAIGGALPIVTPSSGYVPFPQGLGATIGLPTFTGVRSGRRGYRGSRRYGYGTAVGGYGYPVLYPMFGPVGASYDQPADDQQGPPPAEMNYGPQQQQPSEESRIQTYSAPSSERPEPAEDRPMFYVALTDNSVYTAVAYWVEDETLNYITPQGRHNQVSLALVDRATTARLNQGSKFQLHLPGA
jgi:hypothetical protein